jgi:hypothetical protein
MRSERDRQTVLLERFIELEAEDMLTAPDIRPVRRTRRR